jgi:hypothetical protein
VTEMNTSLAPGDVVSGLEPSELVEVQKISAFGSKTLVEGVGCQTHLVVRRPLTDEQLAKLIKVRGKPVPLTEMPPCCSLVQRQSASG